MPEGSRKLFSSSKKNTGLILPPKNFSNVMRYGKSSVYPKGANMRMIKLMNFVDHARCG